MKQDLIQIAIDGPAGSGKTTVSLQVAGKLGLSYISTGRIFRSYAFAMRDIDCKDEAAVEKELKQFEFGFKDGCFLINGLDVTIEILKDIHSMNASIISRYPAVRKRYEKDLKEVSKTTSLVMDGRDIGTVVLPDTPYKFYLDAKIEERVKRRAKEMELKPGSAEYKKLEQEIKNRDQQDMTRAISPLKQAPDAVYIDSTNMTIDEVVQFIVDTVNKKRETLIIH